MTQTQASAVVQAAIADPDRAVLFEEYFRHLPDEDLPETAADAAATVDEHTRLAAQRKPGTTKVRVFNPRSKVGTSNVTVVDIVNDDMPHLVDAVVSTLSAAGVRVFRVQHPILAVQRDDQGRLLGVHGSSHQVTLARDVVKESWIHVLVDRLSDAERAEAIEQEIADVLADVRAVGVDSAAMHERAVAIAQRIRRPEPIADEAPVDNEPADLLDWLADGHMIFVGYRRDTFDGPGGTRRIDNASGLGVFRQHGPAPDAFDDGSVPDTVSDSAELVLSQTARNAAIITGASPLCAVVREFGSDGAVIAEDRLLGVLVPKAMNADLTTVPVLRRIVTRVLAQIGAEADSYNGQRAVELLSGYPRAELFWADPDRVADLMADVLHGSSRRRMRVFLQHDPYGRFVVVLLFLARDRWTTENRLKLQRVLLTEFAGTDIRYSAQVGQGELVVAQFVVRTPEGSTEVDLADLSGKLRMELRSWDDDLVRSVLGGEDELDTAGALARYSSAFDNSYKAAYSGDDAVADLRRLDALTGPDDLAIAIDVVDGDPAIDRRLKVYSAGATISLSRAFPVLQSMGAEVIDERPFAVARGDGTPCHIYDFGLAFDKNALPDAAGLDEVRQRFSDAFVATWHGHAETDGFNRLVLGAGLGWRQIAVVRAYAHYLQQIGTTYTQGYIEQVLAQHAGITCELVEFFAARFDPDFEGDRDQVQQQISDRITAALDQVSSLDADRILRQYQQLIWATMRTNAFQSTGSDGETPFAFKLEPKRIPGVPKPVPAHEIWVYSPSMEGVHLRFGAVARGGLRWSDRPEDFRTEILGLVKAQEVKNAVIVPVGAKGGFVVRRPPTPTGDPAVDRDAFLAEGIRCYRAFITALLDVTDDRAGSKIVPPQRVVRHDADDSYLVVAADKGTASFSDIANSVAVDRGFWLGDAFASGGSAGYDHKGMGITARGAWESVKHHFREMGVDTQAQEFTAVGIGDMGGDVFGNGVLLSEHLRLVAAFNHLHIFIDPHPVAASSFAERRRLFNLPRSTWADYDSALISVGGGVWERSAKSIPISDQVRAALGLAADVTALSPTELIRAILLAPVDLLWNGGIGTYVKAATETNASVGDKANDLLRVNGGELRVKVVGEGGNLGVTQLGRIEFARAGGRINTDAIDNSAGVDTSDHEVNIKIALTPELASGALNPDERNEFLASMTDEVARLVLADNTAQNRLLGVSRAHAAAMLSVHQRLIAQLASTAGLDRALEYLPDDEEIAVRTVAGQGLSSPELSVLIAYVKSSAAREMIASELPDDEAFASLLPSYFPTAMQDKFAKAVAGHPLSREIVTTMTVNDVVNGGGLSYLFRVQEETAASITDGIRAYKVITDVFGLPELLADIAGRDNVMPAATQDRLVLDVRRLLDRSSRWLLSRRPQPLSVSTEIARYRGTVAALTPRMPELLCGVEHDNVAADTAELVGMGADPQLARRVAYSLYTFSLLDVTDVALETGRDPLETAQVYYALSAHLDFDRMLSEVTALARGDRWHALARQAIRDDLYRSMRMIAADVLSSTSEDQDAAAKIDQWENENASRLARARITLAEIAGSGAGDLAALSVAAREVRAMIR